MVESVSETESRDLLNPGHKSSLTEGKWCTKMKTNLSIFLMVWVP